MGKNTPLQAIKDCHQFIEVCGCVNRNDPCWDAKDKRCPLDITVRTLEKKTILIYCYSGVTAADKRRKVLSLPEQQKLKDAPELVEDYGSTYGHVETVFFLW